MGQERLKIKFKSRKCRMPPLTPTGVVERMTGERDQRLSITSPVHFLAEEQVLKMREGQGVLTRVLVARVMDSIEEGEEEEEAPTLEEGGEVAELVSRITIIVMEEMGRG